MTKITVSPRLLSVVGRNLYEGNPALILCRELIQNSRDAQLANQSNNPILLSLDIHSDSVYIMCSDTGIGMDKTILEDVFLSLGDTYNPSELTNKTGGFGIAKAAIFAADFWSIATRDNYLDYSMLERNEDTSTRDTSLNGTKITCRFDKLDVYPWDVSKIVAMLDFSDIAVNFSRNDSLKPVGKILHGYTGKVLDTRYFNDDKTCVVVSLYPTITCDSNTYQGYDIFRINGLVQFLNSTYSERKTNIVVDVSTSIIPGDDNYPFSLSRESIKSDIKEFVNTIIRSENENAYSSNKKANASTEDEFENDYINPIRFNADKIRQLTDNSMVDFTDIFGDFSDNSNDGLNGIHVNVLKPDRYERTLMRMYAYILSNIQDKSFYVGITHDSDIIGYNGTLRNGEKLYAINPHAFDSITNKNALILAVWSLCCHELAHNESRTHNEEFTSAEGTLSRTTPLQLINITSYIIRTILKRL